MQVDFVYAIHVSEYIIWMLLNFPLEYASKLAESIVCL